MLIFWKLCLADEDRILIAYSLENYLEGDPFFGGKSETIVIEDGDGLRACMSTMNDSSSIGKGMPWMRGSRLL